MRRELYARNSLLESFWKKNGAKAAVFAVLTEHEEEFSALFQRERLSVLLLRNQPGVW